MKFSQIISLLPILLLTCWERQENVVSPPSHPRYTLSGTVSYQRTSAPLNAGSVTVVMTELYQGDFLDTMRTQTNSLGYYQFDELYRGRYDLHVHKGLDSLYSGEVGIIKYEDRTFDIEISSPDSSLQSN